MNEKYTPPEFKKPANQDFTNSFHCPHCGVFALQRHSSVQYTNFSNNKRLNLSQVTLSHCDSCNKFIIWEVEHARVIFPSTSLAPKPLDDMPNDVKVDYEEARQIVNVSPRGAMALLRLCVQKLMKHLGEKGKRINDDIGNLVKKGLPVEIQQALDGLRVIGNNAVHPGQIDLKDDRKTAIALFGLINVIVDNRISQPKRIAEVYSKIPQTALDAIEKRDSQE